MAQTFHLHQVKNHAGQQRKTDKNHSIFVHQHRGGGAHSYVVINRNNKEHLIRSEHEMRVLVKSCVRNPEVQQNALYRHGCRFLWRKLHMEGNPFPHQHRRSDGSSEENGNTSAEEESEEESGRSESEHPKPSTVPADDDTAASNERAQLQQHLEQSQATVAAQQMQLGEQAAALQAKDAANAQLTAQVRTVQAALERERAAHRTSTEMHRKADEDSRAASEILQKAKVDLQTLVVTLQQQLGQLRQDHGRQLERQRVEHEQRLGVLYNELTETRILRDEMTTRNALLEATRERLSEQCRQKDDRLAVLEGLLGRIHGDLGACGNQISRTLYDEGADDNGLDEVAAEAATEELEVAERTDDHHHSDDVLDPDAIEDDLVSLRSFFSVPSSSSSVASH